MYASALAYNKSYTFYLLIPKHESEAYWEEIEEGAKKCEDTRRDFHIEVEIRFYERSSEESFREEGNKILEACPEGVIVVPSSLDVTREFTEALHHKSIPFILLDSYMPDLRPLSFFGQDSFCSGFFAAKMLMMLAAKEDEILLMRQTKDGRVVSKQQDNREVGFRHYMHDHFPNVKITMLDLPLNGTRAEFVKMLEKFFDVCIGNEEDAQLCLGFKPDADVEGGKTDAEGYYGIFKGMMKEFGFKYVVSTLRESLSATRNGWKALIYDGKEFYQSKHYDINPIIDRVGGGDSFSGGLIHGLLTKETQGEALEFAVAASALKHTIPGDFNLVSADEVESLAGGNANGRVQR